MRVNTLGLMTVLSCLRNTALAAERDTQFPHLVKNPQQTTFKAAEFIETENDV